MSLALDLLLIAALGVAPAALALYLIRARLGGPSPLFWSATALALAALGAFTFGATWIATIVSEGEARRCSGEGLGGESCEFAMLWVTVAALASAISIAAFCIGAVAARVWLMRRRRSVGGG